MLIRSAVIWLGVRLTLVFFGLAVYGPIVAAGVAAVVVAIVLADTRASHETLLVANLGFSRRHLAVWALVAAGLLEGAAQVGVWALLGWLGSGSA